MTFGVMVGSTQDGGPCEVRMGMQGEKWPWEVKMSMRGGNGHMR